MITEDQTAVIDFLAAPSTHGGATVERIDTHASIVFLAGTRAYKLKRAVRFDYLDFSTSERRRSLCEAEVRLNRRTAPTLYRGVVAVTRLDDGSYALGGNGKPVDWVVEMNRFTPEALFDRLASVGALDVELMSPLAAAIADFHKSAEHRSDHGGKAGMSWVIEGNVAGFAEFGGSCLDPSAANRVTDDSRRELDHRGEMLERRRESGFVRQCHGDLHLRNIVLLDGTPTLFDGVEFNDEISCTDVLYDLAFLLMDLWRRKLPHHANSVWNRYLVETADFEGVALLPLFLSCRAAVRAKTSATAAQVQRDVPRRLELEDMARDYLAMAEHLLHPPHPCLVAVGGFSGSGKSTLARGLAPAVGAVPGAVVLRSDETRKRLCGVPLLQRLGPEGYSSPVSERVYSTLAEEAALVLRAGHSVVVDAVYARAADRSVIEQVAETASTPFIGLWLEAPESELIARTEQRRNDASDADATVVRMQRAQDTGDISWCRLDASIPSASVLSAALNCVRQRLRDGSHSQKDGFASETTPAQNPWVIAMAASAGGIRALQTVLSALPRDLPAAVVVVQHRTASSEPNHLRAILARATAMPVVVAAGDQIIEPGHLYLARSDLHLTVSPEGRFTYVNGRKIRFLSSSANPLFESAAVAFKNRLVAVVLTGSGSDASDGVQNVKAHGGLVIAQDPSSAEHAGMPAAAVLSGSVDFILPLEEIGPALDAIVHGRPIPHGMPQP